MQHAWIVTKGTDYEGDEVKTVHLTSDAAKKSAETMIREEHGLTPAQPIPKMQIRDDGSCLEWRTTYNTWRATRHELR